MSQRLRGWRKVVRDRRRAPSSSPPRRATCASSATWSSTSRCSGLLVAVAVGKLFGYEGNVIVIADGGPASARRHPAAFDSFRAGNTVDGTSLYPMCVRVNDFQAHYLANGQATSFAANIDYQAGDDLNSDTWRPYRLEVNHPLRVGGDRVYLQGHGYAPTFTVTFPDGQKRSQTVQWRPEDPRTLLSSGVIRDRPARAAPSPTPANAASTRSRSQGLLAPTEQLDGKLLSSSYPGAERPRGRRRHLPRRHRPGHRAAAVAVLAGSAADRPGPAGEAGSGQPARRRAGTPRRRHRGAVRRRDAVRQPAGLPRSRPRSGCWCSR